MLPIKAAYLSFMALPPGDHAARTEWHQMDHMPEQFGIPGIAWGQRYVSPRRCVEARLHQVGILSEVEYLIVYLMNDPLRDTLREFGELADRLRAQGRMFDSIGKLRGAYTILETHAAPRALIAPAVVPFRPHRGIYTYVEQVTGTTGELQIELPRRHRDEYPTLCQIPGVAGFWTTATNPEFHTGYSDSGLYHATLVYLDQPVLEVAARLNEFFSARRAGPLMPVLAGPFETTTFFEWDQFNR